MQCYAHDFKTQLRIQLHPKPFDAIYESSPELCLIKRGVRRLFVRVMFFVPYVIQ